MLHELVHPRTAGPLAARLREQARLALRALSPLLGVTYAALRKAETGDTSMTALAVRAVAHLLQHLTGEAVKTEDGGLRLGPVNAAYLDAVRNEELQRRRMIVRGVLAEYGIAHEVTVNHVLVHGPEVEFTIDLWEGTMNSVNPNIRISLGRGLLPWHVADFDKWSKLLVLAPLLASGKLSDDKLDVFAALLDTND